MQTSGHLTMSESWWQTNGRLCAFYQNSSSVISLVGVERTAANVLRVLKCARHHSVLRLHRSFVASTLDIPVFCARMRFSEIHAIVDFCVLCVCVRVADD